MLPSFIFFTVLLSTAHAGMMMMGGGDMGVGTASTACPGDDGVACARDGSSNYNTKSLSIVDGRITGTIISNICPSHEYGGVDPRDSSSVCTEITFPVAQYVSDLPLPTPLLGAIGFSVTGVNLYGPYEAGLSCDTGSCPAGVDVATCEAMLQHSCPEFGELLDSCAGHAQPYHYHLDMKCYYDDAVSSTHSPLLSIGLDGRGIYGQWEGAGEHPTGLDACGGHFGDVPAYIENGVEVLPAQTNVYHYHTSEEPPYTIACYGPVADLSTCQSLYATCNDGTISVEVSNGSFDYDTDCPCFRDQNGAAYNLARFGIADSDGSSTTSSTTTTATTTAAAATTTTTTTTTAAATTTSSTLIACSELQVYFSQMTADGKVDISDLALLLTNWGACQL